MLPSDVVLIDAPVLGSLSEVEAGTLTIFLGGPDDAVAPVGPVLEALGTVMHMGPLGCGAAAKLVANATLLGTLALLGEAFALGTGLGLEQGRIFDVLSATPLAAQAARRRPVFEDGDVPRRFRLVLGLKDASLVVDEATHAGVETLLLNQTKAWFEDAVRAGMGEQDYSLILRHIADAQSGKR
jgi:3-hydroxyisobutyrate dehydrogenase-like beta-hydroxyacid dehydrogenase